MPAKTKDEVEDAPEVEQEAVEEAPAAEPEPTVEDDPTEDHEPVTKAKGPKVAVRTSVNSWWCPKDDTAMPRDAVKCSTCGFKP